MNNNKAQKSKMVQYQNNQNTVNEEENEQRSSSF